MKSLQKFIYIVIIYLFIIAPVSNANSPNPLSANQEAIEIGKKLYKVKCAKCHGIKATGINSGHLQTPNLRKYRKGYSAFTDIIVNGYLRMPAWGGMGKINVQQINQLASYLESIAFKKSNWNKK
ncbi:MAG: cytochrome c [Alphaproteobacteria bacterium]|nr:cytochrome c [Alphaproteobacteria bacterium]